MKVLAVLDSVASQSTLEITVLRAGWSMIRTNNYETARTILSAAPEVIICEQTLADGSWQDLLNTKAYELVRHF